MFVYCVLQAEIYRAQQKDKLQQLELGGLVDYYTPHATTAAAAAAAGGEQQNAGTIKDEPASVDAGTVHEQQQQQKEEEEEQPQKPKQKGRGTKKASGKGKTAAAAAAAAGSGGDEPYAIFIVIGSRGDHYTIKLTDERRSCQCLDHRLVGRGEGEERKEVCRGRREGCRQTCPQYMYCTVT